MLKKVLFLLVIAMMVAAVVGCNAKLPRKSIENVGGEPKAAAEPVAQPEPQPEPQPVIDEDPMEVPAANDDEAPTPDIGGEDLAEESLPEEAPAATAAEQTPETMMAQAETEAAQPAKETAEEATAAQPEDAGIATTPDELPAPEPILEAPATATSKPVTEPEVVEATKPESPAVAQPETVEAVKPQAEPEPMVDPEKEDLSDIYETPAVTPSATTDTPAAAVDAPATVEGPGYYIQVGAFGDTVNATRALNKLKDEGFAGSRLVTRDSGLVAVQAGVFPDEATAEEALSTITTLYPGSKVVKGE